MNHNSFEWVKKEDANPVEGNFYLCIIENKIKGGFYAPYVAKYIGGGLFSTGIKNELTKVDSSNITHISGYSIPNN